MFLVSVCSVSLGVRVPPQVLPVHCQLRLPVLRTPHVLLYDFASDTDDVLSLPVLDHVESLQGADDVFCCDARLVAAGIAIASSCILAFIGLQ